MEIDFGVMSTSLSGHLGGLVALAGSAALCLTDSFQVDTRGVRDKYVNYGAGNSPCAPNWRAELDSDGARLRCVLFSAGRASRLLCSHFFLTLWMERGGQERLDCPGEREPLPGAQRVEPQ